MTYTDYFDQELNEGDVVVYPHAAGSRSACFVRYRIEKIVPLITHRNMPNMLMRADQRSQRFPTMYTAKSNPAKRFVIQACKKTNKSRYSSATHKFTIRFTENVIKAPNER